MGDISLQINVRGHFRFVASHMKGTTEASHWTVCVSSLFRSGSLSCLAVCSNSLLFGRRKHTYHQYAPKK